MKIYEPGSSVSFTVGGIEGTINCVSIYAHGGVLYEVVYWQGGDRKSVWVNEQEISGVSKKKIGFN